MSGPVLASATTRLRLRSGEDVVACARLRHNPAPAALRLDVSAYAQATGTDTSCWPSKVTTSTEATSAGATRAVPSSTVPCFSPVGETSQLPACMWRPARSTTSSRHRWPALMPSAFTRTRTQPAAGVSVTVIDAPVLGSLAAKVRTLLGTGDAAVGLAPGVP